MSGEDGLLREHCSWSRVLLNFPNLAGFIWPWKDHSLLFLSSLGGWRIFFCSWTVLCCWSQVVTRHIFKVHSNWNISSIDQSTKIPSYFFLSSLKKLLLLYQYITSHSSIYYFHISATENYSAKFAERLNLAGMFNEQMSCLHQPIKWLSITKQLAQMVKF